MVFEKTLFKDFPIFISTQYLIPQPHQDPILTSGIFTIQGSFHTNFSFSDQIIFTDFSLFIPMLIFHPHYPPPPPQVSAFWPNAFREKVFFKCQQIFNNSQLSPFERGWCTGEVKTKVNYF